MYNQTARAPLKVSTFHYSFIHSFILFFFKICSSSDDEKLILKNIVKYRSGCFTEDPSTCINLRYDII